ncbi:MAG: Rpn family recombination-promoting nuclease/putative transposase, partial [Treponema sp.]|nr:Rpn family recombination-promoting nuclease/putative transposase [Treponema sp.]
MAYKDSLFRSIFANEKSALALCDAVLGTSHSGGNPQVVMNTLGETLWTPRKNDLSFILNDCLVVIVEHQSTINENMPYRMLQYICRLFDNDISDRKAIYRQARIELLRPIFIVLYNGPTDFPDRKILRLSDAFRKVPGFEGISLELEVYVYNVNEGRNRSIMESCAELKGYAYFVSRVRRHEA